jgi:CTP synthase
VIVERLGLPATPPDLAEWEQIVDRIKAPREAVPIALVGKYVQLRDAYLSVAESLRHAALHYGVECDIHWIDAEQLERDDPDTLLKDVKGIVVPGGFGYRGVEGMAIAARYAREHGVPYLGLCLGFQVMVIEFARHVLGTDAVNSTEFDLDSPHPVIHLMPSQVGIEDRGGTMRLGSYPCLLTPGTHAAGAYGVHQVEERHRHRYEFNNEYREVLAAHGLVFSGLSPDGNLVEIAELAGHPWMVGSQFHPEMRSRPNRPHPLFAGFMCAAEDVVREGEQYVLE